MTVHRFFVPPPVLETNPIALDGPLAHQLARVLRFSPGDQIELLDNTGRACIVELSRVDPGRCLALLLNCYHPRTEPSTDMILYQAMPQGRKIEWVLQKATELGARAIVPVVTERSLVRDAEQLGGKKLERWSRIIQEAAEQSGRALLPELCPALTLQQAIGQNQAEDLALIGSPEPCARSIREVLDREPLAPAHVRLYIGPEGGFESDEIAYARDQGLTLVTLGPRTLRTETAGLALLAVVSYALGEMEAR